MSFYGYAPSRYSQSPWAGAVQNIGNIASSAVLKGDELIKANKLIQENKVNNQFLISGMQGAIDNWPDQAFSQAGTTKDAVKSQISRIDPKAKNTEVLQSLNSIISPVREQVSSLAGEQKTQARHGEISGVVSTAMQPKTEELAGPVRPGEMPPMREIAPAPRTKEDIVGRTMESWPTGRPVPTMTELEEEPRVATAPSALDLEKQKLAGQRESRLQDMTDYQAERIKIAWRNAFLRERGQNINVATDSGKFKKDMHDAYIASAAAKAKRLPALYTTDGYPTGAVWSEQDQADFDAFVAANIAKAVDMGNVPGEILMEANKGEIVRRTAPGTYTTRPQSLAPSPAPAPVQPKPQSDPLGLF